MNKDGQWSLPVRYIAFGLGILFLLIVLWAIHKVIEPLIIAAFIAYLISPIVNFLTRRTGLSRNKAVNLVYIVVLVLFIGTPASLTSLFFDEFTQVITDVLHLYDQLILWLEKPTVIPGIPIDFGQLANQLLQLRATFLASLPTQIFRILGLTSLGAAWVIVILVGVYYFLAEWPALRNGFIGLFPEKYAPELNELYQRVRQTWMSYLRGQLLLMVIVAVAFSIAWAIIGIPGALVLGIMGGFMTLVPDVGPFLAATSAVGVALLEGSTWNWMPANNLIVALITLAAYFLLITIKNFWIRPVIMGRSVQMHEALVLIFITLAIILWGILGALLIVPLMSSLAIIFDYLRRRILGLPPFPSTGTLVEKEGPTSRVKRIAIKRIKNAYKKEH